MKTNFAILILIYLSLILLGYGYQSPEQLIVFAYIGWGQLILSIYSWIKKGNKLISPYIIFLLCFYIFNFGQCLVMPFGLNSVKRPIIGYLGITPSDVLNAEIYTLLMLASFHLGAIIYIDKNKTVKIHNDYDVRKILKIGWTLFIISIIPFYYDLISNFFLAMSRGYGALYKDVENIGIENIWTYIGMYFVPACICLYVGYKGDHRKQRIIEYILIFNAFIYMMTGGRSNGVILLGLIVVLHNYLYKSFNHKQIIVLSLASVFLLAFLTFIADTRTSKNRSLNNIEISLKDNAALNAVAEMGGSMSCLIKTQDFVPSDEDYRYGSTYFYAFTSLIPNIGFWDIHPAKKGANMSNWLTDKLNLRYGTGFSMTAEAYINFGPFCWVFMILLGFLLSWCFRYIEIGIKHNNAPVIIFSLILFYFSLKMPRNNFINIVRPLFFYALPIYYLCKSKSIVTLKK